MTNKNSKTNDGEYINIGIWVAISCAIIAIVIGIIICFLPELPKNKLIKFFGLDPQKQTRAEILKYAGIISGCFIVLGTLLTSNKTNQLTLESNELTRKGQLDSRFIEASKLLGSENTSEILSGVNALHRIAVESYGKKGTKNYVYEIHDILCAYLQENSKIERDTNKFIVKSEITKPQIVFQTIVTLLFQDYSSAIVYDGIFTNLDNVVLKGCGLSFANLRGVKLSGADLSGAHLHRTDLSEAYLSNTDLSNADLFGANLSGTHLFYAKLTKSKSCGVDFTGADLLGTDFTEAKLKGAVFNDAKCSANFIGAYLFGADFTNVEFFNVDFTGADFKEKFDFNEAVLIRALFGGEYSKEIDKVNADYDEKTSFKNTILESYSLEEITRPGRSLELTTPAEDEEYY
jgi:uncharacterized protein YjbI with pentapeptide repeats